jgi:c-di-GMP-binding flagellar brake protein YcgR
MDLRDYKAGAMLCLDIHDDWERRIDRDFISRFEEVIDEYEANIAIPVVEGVVYAVRPGWKITVYMQDGDNIYRFTARVLERKIDGGRHLMRILRLSGIDEAQRTATIECKV